MINVVQQVESAVQTLPPRVVSGNAAQTKDVLPDVRNDGKKYVYRVIQNISASGGTIAYAFSIDCDGVINVHGNLVAGEFLNVTTNERVSVWGAAAWEVATTVQLRTETN